MTARKGWIRLGTILVVIMLPVLCKAAVTGDCSSCHTMHNSEEGQVVAFIFDGSGSKILQEQAFAGLLKTNCIGCHSHAGAETIFDLGGGSVPVVFSLAEPTYPPNGSKTSALAGGNFHWVVNKGDAYGHNVNGISGQDVRFSHAPGGQIRTGECANCHGSLATSQSGCNGCHVPRHHAGSGNVIAGRADGWYRFLGSVMQRGELPEPPPEGVVGIEAPDWEQNPLSTQHNTYKGGAGPYTSYLESGAINQKCTGCHGQFHRETVAESTWIRHPVDAVIPATGEFGEFTTYNPAAPVARQNISALDAGFSQIDHGSDRVSCISCHRPHGSPYPAMLRWGYRDWPGIDSHTEQAEENGCAVCHTTKG